MYVIQNFKQKSIGRKTTILLAALTLSTAVATNALAAGHGGGSGGGGTHIGGGFAGGHVGGGLGGGGFAGHIGVGSAGGRMIGGRMGGDLHYRDHDHDRDHHFRQRFIGSPGYYYDDYGYGLDDGVPTDAYPPPAPAVRAPEAEPACHRTSETFNVPAAGGGTREITVIGCP